MGFLSENCTFTTFSQDIINSSNSFNCGHPDLNDFFINDCISFSTQLLGKSYCFLLDEDPSQIVCAFTVSNDSIKTNSLPNNRKKKINKNIPHVKHFNSYPAVLIGRLGVNIAFQRMGIGQELMDFIKSWFIDPFNKTGCRFIVVDSYNENDPIKYYLANGFDFLFSSKEQEIQYLTPPNGILRTRLMLFDLIVLSPN